MGSADSAGAWALRAGVGAALLALCQCRDAPPPPACAQAPDPRGLPRPRYRDAVGQDPGGAFLSPLVNSFLGTVQPNPFPEDFLLTTISHYQQALSDQGFIREVLVYEVGFLVCAAIGVLYIVLVPVVGLLLACCRCCGNCGGEMYQRQTSSTDCRRRTLYWSALVTTAIILAGNICMFKSNEALAGSVDEGPGHLNASLENVGTFVTAVPDQINHVVNESTETVRQVTRNLEDIGAQLGAEIQQRFAGPVAQAVQPLAALDQEIGNVSAQLHHLNQSLAQLQSSMDRIQDNVTEVDDRINRTLSNPRCLPCHTLKPMLEESALDGNFTVPNIGEYLRAVDEVENTNLTSKLEEVKSFFNSIPLRVTNDTKEVVEESKQRLGVLSAQISQLTSDLPLSALTDVSDWLGQARGAIGGVTAQVDEAEYIRWSVCVALCCAVLLVVVCNVLGLVLGPLGLSPSADPTKRSCAADCGGTFLMMGAGFSFLFSWLFMIVVLLLFLLGGNVHTLVCRPWSDGQLLKFVDSSGLIPELGDSSGLKSNISVSDIYSKCKDDQPLWTTLRLEELVDLDELLNVSKYTEEIRQQFEDSDITLSTVTLLSPEVEQQLRSFAAKVGGLDLAAFTQQMDNVSRINLNTTADKLDDLAPRTENETAEELRAEASDLRQIQADIEMTILPQLKNLNSTIKSLQSTLKKINETVGEVLRNVGVAQDFLNTNTTQIVKTESRKFLDCQMGYFIAYADWAKFTITQQVGRCGPVAAALDSAETVLCSYVVASLNAFWFSLGWCVVFFIPSIIFTIKLAKYYRKMKISDNYGDHILMNPIPRARMKIM